MLRWLLVLLALVLGGWLVFDGGRALATGQYTTPNSGPYAGQLGPWATLVVAVGLDPRGLPVRLAHLGLGGAWLVAAALVPLRPTQGRRLALICALASLVYLPIGTALGVMALLLLNLTRPRRAEV